MRRLLLALLFLVLPLRILAAGSAITRVEGFRLLWEPLHRTVEEVSAQPFKDIAKDHPDWKLLIFAKARKILDDEKTFRPEEPLHLRDTLFWLLRSRNVDAPADINATTLPQFLAYYPLLSDPTSLAANPTVTAQELTELMQKLDTFLRGETHTVSYYGEDFAGERTAFGETFNPAELTAAHRTLPYNTLVRVTAPVDVNCQLSIVNCPTQSVTVRINDRGPYVTGRDMDLSLAAFEKLAPRGTGVLTNVTFERLGGSDLVAGCPAPGYERRLGKTVLSPGIPKIAQQGTTLSFSGNQSFRVLQILPPRGHPLRFEQWTRRGETFEMRFEQLGSYVLILFSDEGKRQRFRTDVVGECNK